MLEEAGMSERNQPRRILSCFVLALLQGLIKGYTWLISPLSGPKCRFYPTCSAYAMQALQRHGPWAGLWLAVGRLAACHPWSRRSGIDPVPDQFEWRAQFGYKRRISRSNPDRNNESSQ